LPTPLQEKRNFINEQKNEQESVKLEKEINLQGEKSENPRKRLIKATTTF
jgi:hypothetical protein